VSLVFPWRSRLAAGVVCSTLAIGVLPLSSTPPALAAPSAAPAVAAPDGSSPITASAFKNPANTYKPATRWWWQAPLSVEESVREITAIADAGFGEVEIAYSAGAWADQVQRDNLRAVLDRANSLGIKVSMTMGAAWPVQTPNTSTGTEFVQKELQYGRADVTAGAAFDGEVPRPFDDPTLAKLQSELVAVTVAKVLKKGPAAELLPLEQRPRWGTPIKVPSESTILDPTSMQDVTSQVKDGRLSWRAPEGEDWIVFAFWQREAAKPVTSAFDPAAAKAATEYLDINQVGADNVDALKSVGADMFEDSLELNADSLFWSDSFLADFESEAGYSMAAYLPLMFQHGMSRYWVPTVEPLPDFELPDGEGERVRNDYYTLITSEYLQRSLVFQDWAQTTYGMDYKTQAAFGQDLEPIRSFRELAKAGARVEGESYNSGDRWPLDMDQYGWKEALDWQRVVASGAHQGGETKISTELGAQRDRTFQQNLSDYKQMMDKEWAAGFTHPYLHGFAYQSTGAAWPGKLRFGDNTADSWNDSFPQWSDMTSLTSYWARGTQVLETGTPRTDVAIYRDGFLTTAARTPADDGAQPEELFDTDELERTGYSVQFIDPIGLGEEGVVGDGVLFPEGPNYQALIVDERMISAAAADAIARAAEAGVRIVFVGETPSREKSFGTGEEGAAAVQAAVQRALAVPTTMRVATQADAAAALEGLSVTPRVDWTEDARALTQLRHVGDTTYLYVYNPTDDDLAFTPSIEGVGSVSTMDLMTGTIDPASVYSSKDGRTSIPTQLKPLETVVYALQSDAAGLHVTGSSRSDDEFVYRDGSIYLRTTEEGTRTVTLSNGRSKTVTAVPATKTAANPGPYQWKLTVDAVTPTGPKTIDVGTLPGFYPLWDWRSLPQIAGESGVGTYTGTLNVPANWTGAGKGVSLDLGDIEGTARIWINDRQVGTQIDDDQVWDAGPYLTAGANAIRIELRTTLRNAVTQYAKTNTRTQAYGILGPIKINPSVEVPIWIRDAEPADSTVTVDPVTTTYGKAAVITAAVRTGTAGIPAGFLSILDGDKEIRVVRLDAEGRASIELNGLPVGACTLTARYEGSPTVLSSRTDFAVTVNQAVSEVSAAAIKSSARKATLRITVASDAAIEAGTVAVSENGNRVGTTEVDANGNARLALGKISRGAHTYTLEYGGTTEVAASTGTVEVTITR
jgi:hypothetical protein